MPSCFHGRPLGRIGKIGSMDCVKMTSRMTLQKRAELLGEQQFLGVPIVNFERGGREQLTYLLQAGLAPNSKLVDLGCGVLRGGYWLIHFLDTGCYCGIEP